MEQKIIDSITDILWLDEEFIKELKSIFNDHSELKEILK